MRRAAGNDRSAADSSPPRLAEGLLGGLLPRHEREEVLGDMAEAYARRERRLGSVRSALWYWRQALAIPARVRWRRRAKMSLDRTELRLVLRNLGKSPGFTAVAILSLALGIGANTAIFSTIRSVLYAQLPVDRPEELAFVYQERPAETEIWNYGSTQTSDPVSGAAVQSNVSYPLYRDLRTAVPDARLAAFNFLRRIAVAVDDLPAIASRGMIVSGNYFSTLGLRVALGRPLTPDDDRPDAPRVAVIGHAFWQRVFGGDPSVVGRTATINGVPFRIVGVTPREYQGLSPSGATPPTEITVPLSAQPVMLPSWTPDDGSLFTSDNAYWLRLLARTPAGTPVDPLLDAMTATISETMVVTSMIAEEDADQVRARLLPGARGFDSLRGDTGHQLRILAAVVAAVLLVACANLAGLLLARGAQRRHELAVRRALGAGRLRLMRQLLLESLVLALAGGAAGLLLALWSAPALTAALTAGLGRVEVRVDLDWTLLAATALVSLAAAVLCGLLPALRLTRVDPREHLTGRSGPGGASRLVLGRALIAIQIAVSIPLVVGAGLFIRTLANLDRIDPGFDARDLIVFQLDPSLIANDRERVKSIYREVLAEMEALPGVRSATLVGNALVSGWISNTWVTVGGEEFDLLWNPVGPRFFETLEIPILDGRPIGPQDDAPAPPVAVLNETAARQLFDGRAVGRSFRIGERDVEIVGVAADSKYSSLRREVRPTFFDSYLQRPAGSMHVVFRATVPATALEPTIRAAVARVDSGLPVIALRTQSEQIASTIGRERIFARLLGLFGGFALLLACIGLHGVTAFSVARRRSEIGIRLALGARAQQVRWLVLRQVLTLAVAGLAVGLVAAAALGSVVASLLYGLEPTDPPTLVAAAAVMLAVALVAGWLPARRASRTEAVMVLARD